MSPWAPRRTAGASPDPPWARAFQLYGSPGTPQAGKGTAEARHAEAMVHRFSPGLEAERLAAQCKCHAAAFNKGMFRLLDCRAT